jgi:hypothetical protein
MGVCKIELGSPPQAVLVFAKKRKNTSHLAPEIATGVIAQYPIDTAKY